MRPRFPVFLLESGGRAVAPLRAYTSLAETSDHGYPVLEHVKRLVKDEVIWAPAIAGAFVLTNPWRRFRPAHRPGRLDRLFQPH